MAIATTADLLAAARRGEADAFERLFMREIPKLRTVLRRLVGHPDEVDDLSQQALLRAHEKLSTFRGDSSPGTWLCAIGTRLAIDHLRRRRRWRERAQIIFAAACLADEALQSEVGAALGAPDFAYDVGEHIAYCFTCVGRTLDPDAQAALVLRDVLQMSNAEAADAIGVSRSVLRHQLTAARQSMQRTYDGLCALVSKEGACWQCAGLREAAPADRRGDRPPESLDWEHRLVTIRRADGDGRSRGLHDLFFRRTADQEEARRGDEQARTDCGRAPELD